MSLRIGEIIKEKISEKGWSLVKFSEEVGMSYRNAMYLLKRPDISVEQLMHISKVLDYDFMNLFSTSKEVNETASNTNKLPTASSEVPNDFTTMVISLTIAGGSSTFEQFPDFLKKVRKYAEGIGFKVL